MTAWSEFDRRRWLNNATGFEYHLCMIFCVAKAIWSTIKNRATVPGGSPFFATEKCKRRQNNLPALREQPEHINQHWSMDFVSGSLYTGRRFRALTLVDNFARECTAIEVDHCTTGHGVGHLTVWHWFVVLSFNGKFRDECLNEPFLCLCVLLGRSLNCGERITMQLGLIDHH